MERFLYHTYLHTFESMFSHKNPENKLFKGLEEPETAEEEAKAKESNDVPLIQATQNPPTTATTATTTATMTTTTMPR